MVSGGEFMFSARLAQLREERGLTRKEVAEKLNIDQTTYGKYELSKRQPDYDTLKKIASFFDVSIDYLLGLTDERNPGTSSIDLPPEAKVLFRDVKKLTPEQLELVTKLVKEFINED